MLTPFMLCHITRKYQNMKPNTKTIFDVVYAASKAITAILGKTSKKDSIASMSNKKETTIGVRVDDQLLNILVILAKEEDRPLAAMTRKLVAEALHKRGLLKKKK